MSRIHPAYQNRCHDMLTVKERSEEDAQAQAQAQAQARPRPSVLTVWKRSSMTFQGTDGFTVFDHHGRLAFRVDNYSRKSCCITGGELVLMDGAGNALLTLKPQVINYEFHSSFLYSILVFVTLKYLDYNMLPWMTNMHDIYMYMNRY